jgi:glycosyltransferase involved in cell wall biosynthesis
MKLMFGIKSMEQPGGGAERVLAVVASGLASRGHDVSVLTFDAPGGHSFYPLDARVRRIALGVGPTDRRTGWNEFRARLRALRRATRQENPDAAVGFMHSTFVPLAFATVGLGVPLVASEHIVPEYYRDRRREYGLLVLGCLLSKRVTVLSAAVRDLYPIFLRRRMVPMPNPVVVGAASTSDAPMRTGATRTVLSVGRLEAQKDHATLIDAFAMIAGRFPEWNVRIVGDGSLRAELARKIAEHGLEARVTLAGTTADIAVEYARADVMAVSSRFESFGMATAEALSAGLPVVGFADCPGTNELIAHGRNGWLVEARRPEDRSRAFAEGLSALMDDRALRTRLGEGGRESVRQFEPQSIVARWEGFLEDVVGR